MRRPLAALGIAGILLTACVNGGGSPAKAAQGIRGIVLAGPQCPVETADSPCPDRPLPGVRVEVRRGGNAVGAARTDGQGRFTVGVDPGTYEVRVAPGQQGFMSSKPITAVVREGAFTDVTVSVDTGIR
jgi:hypothetical protein